MPAVFKRIFISQEKMKSSPAFNPRWLLLGLLILAGLVCTLLLRNIPSTTSLGRNDFIGYWSATYLLRSGQNPYDLQLMDQLQHVQMKTGLDATIMAWNPPTLFVLLLPLSWLSFTTARFVWLTINLIIVLTASLMVARLYIPKGNNAFALIFLAFAMGFPQVLSGFYMGQVTFLVYLGLVGCMVLIRKGQWFWAGAALILTIHKPQLVVLPLIYLLIIMARQGQYRGWAGLFMAGAVCSIILFILRPACISDVLGEMKIAPVHWATPTIGGFLSYLQITELARSLILLLLPLPFILALTPAGISMETAVALLTLITIPTTFFGWSYDQTMLLIPVAQVFGWMSGSRNKIVNFWFGLAMIIALGFNYIERARATNEVYYLWVPLFWWILFGVSWRFFSSGISTAGRVPQPA